MTPLPADAPRLGRISVVIANHDYGRYVGQAIESALALDWDDVEVVVVDDGSTDDSREVIDRYADRVRALYQENATQRVARNRGFELTTGDVVIHLDSDDVLFPSLGREVAKVWRPGISKVQVQMLRIDADGHSLGTVFPEYPFEPTPEQVRRWAARTSAYPTPPGSGNVYARWFLERIFPLDDSCGPATDSACLAVAPFLGDVVTIVEPLVGYRVHEANVSDLVTDDARFPRTVERARQRLLYTHRVLGTPADERTLSRSRPLLQLRVASQRLVPGVPALPGESRARLLRDTVLSPVHPGPEPAGTRLAILVWCLGVLTAPRRLARRLVRARYRRDRPPTVVALATRSLRGVLQHR
ncbi:glycosyltransferase [Geodermatophilus sp. DSM 45219]|uniref:glycosyltransferase n=1 Tax=Geodermatophilus sp. DSM 45219 TaxID=1881103 RepID=UPI0008888308|nr:glycosyltransferase [Geodermatophilus sp. DSM 45219]SDN55450.1 Glycosyl transferase family 2 [Geodermatophilus sp. DSM 45219]